MRRARKLARSRRYSALAMKAIRAKWGPQVLQAFTRLQSMGEDERKAEVVKLGKRLLVELEGIMGVAYLTGFEDGQERPLSNASRQLAGAKQ